jgi:shikimate kinase
VTVGSGTNRPLVVFIGPPGAGKTRLGKRVARILGAPFIDTDRLIVAQHGPIPEIFTSLGEPEFRRIEREIVAEALEQQAVVSLGGGAILSAQTQAQLTSHHVALITVSAEAVVSRIGGSKRPLARDMNAWSALVDSRREIYERLATATWDTSSRPIDHIAADIADWVADHGRPATPSTTSTTSTHASQASTEDAP